ncbi:hypothetical protein L1049_008515 [Liquidambar formosana]|uniref:Uncharacterized protein n=1 Tax=Liquidambar formosana TaxID=63359 RepID=A0AAP0X8B8_LIQFO
MLSFSILHRIRSLQAAPAADAPARLAPIMPGWSVPFHVTPDLAMEEDIPRLNRCIGYPMAEGTRPLCRV